MAEKLDSKETVTVEELIKSIVYMQEALVRVLRRKRILTEQEVLDEVKLVRSEAERKGRIVSH